MHDEIRRSPSRALRTSIRKDDLDQAKECLELLMEVGDWGAIREHAPLDHRLLMHLADQALPSCDRMDLQLYLNQDKGLTIACKTCRTIFSLNIPPHYFHGPEERIREIFSQYLERLVWDTLRDKVHMGDPYLAGEVANMITTYSQRAFYSDCDCIGKCCKHRRRYSECAKCRHVIRNCERCKGTRKVIRTDIHNLFATWVLLIKTWWPKYWYVFLADPKYGICLSHSSRRDFKRPTLHVTHIGTDAPGFITENQSDLPSVIEWSDATYYSAAIFPNGRVKVGAYAPPLPLIPFNCVCNGTKRCPYCDPTSRSYSYRLGPNGMPISHCLCKGKIACPRCRGSHNDLLKEIIGEVLAKGVQRGG